MWFFINNIYIKIINISLKGLNNLLSIFSDMWIYINTLVTKLAALVRNMACNSVSTEGQVMAPHSEPSQ